MNILDSRCTPRTPAAAQPAASPPPPPLSRSPCSTAEEGGRCEFSLKSGFGKGGYFSFSAAAVSRCMHYCGSRQDAGQQLWGYAILVREYDGSRGPPPPPCLVGVCPFGPKPAQDCSAKQRGSTGVVVPSCRRSALQAAARQLARCAQRRSPCPAPLRPAPLTFSSTAGSRAWSLSELSESTRLPATCNTDKRAPVLEPRAVHRGW